jgi:signal transduction histidine kinase/CheY-like chemotaxis protein
MPSPYRHLGWFAAGGSRLGWTSRRAAADAEARRQAALATVTQRALEGAERPELLAEATALVARILDVPCAAVLAWEPGVPRLAVVAGTGWRAGVVGRLSVDLGRLPAAAAALQGLDPVALAADGGPLPLSEVPLFRDHDVASAVGVAIAPRGRPYGTLVAGAPGARRCTPAELGFLQAVARVLAVALGREYGERALFDEMRMSTVLAHVGRELMGCTEVAALLPRVAELAAQALRCDHALVWLRHADAPGFRPAASHGLPAALAEACAALVLAEADAAPVLAEIAARDTVHLEPPSPRHPVVGSLLQRLGARAVVLAPIVEGDAVVGLLACGHRERGAEIDGTDERVAYGVAQLASTALANARVVEELERASRLKSEFVSTMSHELRTPLNVIIGYTDMLQDATSLAEQAPLLGHIRRASRDLLDLIDGTLNLNRLAAGGDVVSFAAVALAEVWSELERDFAPLAARGGVALRWQEVADLALQTDRRKLKIVLKNLVGNALKFTPAGEIVVAAERVGDRCRLTVRDTGIGIAREALPHVFDMFRQADSSETRAFGGAGLGLYIVRSLLVQLGGEVQVESVLGQGSIFTVVLPLEPEHDAVPDPAPVGPLPPAAAGACPLHTRRTLLFADDLPLNRLLVRRFVVQEFPLVDVLEACDGEQALAMFDAHAPDLVLLDLHMPQLDGWQAASAIRRRPRGLDVPILALSVDASPGAETNAMRAGFQEFIAKPISDYSALKARLAHWLGPRDARGRALPPVPSPTCDACRGEAAATVGGGRAASPRR